LFLIVLRARKANRPEKHEQGSRADNSNKLHRYRPRLISLARYARRRPMRPNHVPLPWPPRPRPWSCAPSHPGGWAEVS
jgi:hypothetical protein